LPTGIKKAAARIEVLPEGLLFAWITVGFEPFSALPKALTTIIFYHEKKQRMFARCRQGMA
jgi:hypothetical protein